jgi:O-antigen ligase
MSFLYDFTWAQWGPLIGLILGGMILYLVAFFAPERWVVCALIVLTPFQLIATRFGTLNMILVYVVFVAFMMKGRLRYYPYMVPFSLIFFAYLLSLTQSQASIILFNITYILHIISNFMIFFIIYNFIRRNKDPKIVLNYFIIMNIFVSIYCLLSLIPQLENISFLGSNLFSNRSERMTGPFGSYEISSEYFAMSIIMYLYFVLIDNLQKYKLYMNLMMGLNFGFLVATGTRGGFIVLVFGIFLFWFFFRKTYSMSKMFIYSLIGMLFLGSASMVITKFTRFNVLFDRLSDTRVEGVIPDSRSKPWPLAWETMQRKPFFGHRPRTAIAEPLMTRDQSIPRLTYPHNLYLHLLVTTGVVGLMAFLFLFLMIFFHLIKARHFPVNDIFNDNLHSLGLILLFMFLVDQIKIEFLRFQFTDYQHWIFILFASFVAFSKNKEELYYQNLKEG